MVGKGGKGKDKGGKGKDRHPAPYAKFGDTSTITCHKCGRAGHKSYECFSKYRLDGSEIKGGGKGGKGGGKGGKGKDKKKKGGWGR